MTATRIELLANDFDNMTFGLGPPKENQGVQKVPEHLFSPKLLRRVAAKKYAACYGATARYIQALPLLIKSNTTMYEMQKNTFSAQGDCWDFSGYDVADLFTMNIAENFSRVTGLKILEISTPEDQGGKCGSGYRNGIKIFEEAVLKTKKTVKESREIAFLQTMYMYAQDLPPIYRASEEYRKASKDEINGTWTSYDLSPPAGFEFKPISEHKVDKKSKNKQLLSIARDAVEKFPDADEIVIDFIDDNLDVIKNALEMLKMDLEKIGWPKKIVMHVWHHDLFDDTDITLRGTIQLNAEEVDEDTDEDTDEEKEVAANTLVDRLDAEGNISEPPRNFAVRTFDVRVGQVEQKVFEIAELIDGIAKKFSAETVENMDSFKNLFKQELDDLRKIYREKLTNMPELTETISSFVKFENKQLHFEKENFEQQYLNQRHILQC